MLLIKKSLKRQDGFTLVELMVVVAIIGLLSAVAIPNFKKYQAKAKISEAKLQLSALYTAETSFFSDYNMYAMCLAYMGFDPGPETPNRYYAIGFSTATAIDNTAYTSATTSGLNTSAVNGCPQASTVTQGAVAGPSTSPSTWFAAGKGIGSSVAGVIGYLPGAGYTSGDQAGPATQIFRAGAAGVISADFTAAGAVSELAIDQTKTLSSVVNGY